MTNNLSISLAFLFFVFSTGCTKETNECDSTKFDCTPVSSVDKTILKEKESVIETLSIKEELPQKNHESTKKIIDEDVTFHTSPKMSWEEQKRVIDGSFKVIIKDEINTVLNADTDTWEINILSKKDGVGRNKGFVIYTYNVTSNSDDLHFLISQADCVAHAQISSEDNKTPIAATLDNKCYHNLEGYF